MSTFLLERSPALDESFEHDTRLRLDGALLAGATDAHGGLTLDELITGVWEGLAVRGTFGCPVCASSMVSRSYDDGEGARYGQCLGCGSKLC